MMGLSVSMTHSPPMGSVTMGEGGIARVGGLTVHFSDTTLTTSLFLLG